MPEFIFRTLAFHVSKENETFTQMIDAGPSALSGNGGGLKLALESVRAGRKQRLFCETH